MDDADIFMIYFAIFYILFVHMRKEKQCLREMHSLFCEMYFHLKLLSIQPQLLCIF